MKRIVSNIFTIFLAIIFMVGLSACDEGLTGPEVEEEAIMESDGLASTNTASCDGPEVVDMDYVASRGYHHVVLRNCDGSLDSFYGDHTVGGTKDWTKTKGTRDPDKVWGDMLGLAVGEGDNVVYVTRRGNGQLHVHRAAARNDGIFWVVGNYRLRAADGSDYVDLVDIDYYPSRSQFVVIVEKADGTQDAFYGNHTGATGKDWTLSGGTRDPDKAWGDLQAVSVGEGDNVVYASLRSNGQIHVHSSLARNDGIFWQKGNYRLQAADGSDYVEVVDFFYTPSRSQHVILLRKADGTTDAFYGNHTGATGKDWTLSGGTRDPDKVWGSIQGVSVGLGDNVVYTSDRGADIHIHASQARNDGVHWTVGSYALK